MECIAVLSSKATGLQLALAAGVADHANKSPGALALCMAHKHTPAQQLGKLQMFD